MGGKEYIEREAAFELVTDLAGQASTKTAYSAFWKSANTLKEMPAADVVEVVRCKECQYGYILNRVCWCNLHDTRMKDTDFCSYGIA